MAGKLGKFQKLTFNYWKGDTLKKHHMGALFMRKPQQATDLMVQLLGWHKGKTLNTFLSQYPTKTFFILFLYLTFHKGFKILEAISKCKEQTYILKKIRPVFCLIFLNSSKVRASLRVSIDRFDKVLIVSLPVVHA